VEVYRGIATDDTKSTMAIIITTRRL